MSLPLPAKVAAPLFRQLKICSTLAQSQPARRRLVSKPADYERRDQRSTKTPQPLSRPSPDHSVGSMFAHEEFVVERLRAFFRDANRRQA
jgi:hypothetical protein